MTGFDSLKGKRVLVTGHTGFKGSWLCVWLSKLGANVYGFALPEENGPAAYTALGIRKLLADEETGNICEGERLAQFFERTRPHLVFHLAAQSLVRRSFEDPLETIQSNFLGTAQVLENVRRQDIPVVVVTSDKCYENKETMRPYEETDPMGGHDVYSMSKGACELLAASYRRSFDLRISTARAGNVIGGGDFAKDRILPDCVRAVRSGKPVLLRNPESVRPWQHVLEPIHGYLMLGDKLLGTSSRDYCEGWNFGPEEDDATTVASLVQGFFTHFGQGSFEVKNDSHQPHEAKLLRLSIEKAKKKLQWSPRWNVDVALKEAAQWYREFEAKRNEQGSMLDFSGNQIEKYIGSLK